MRLGQKFRFNNKCKNCGHKFSVLVTSVEAPPPYYYAFETDDVDIFYPDPSGAHKLMYICAGCNNQRLAAPVIGKYNPGKECNAKCQAATGRQCECSCGGKNHGVSNEG